MIFNRLEERLERVNEQVNQRVARTGSQPVMAE